jgi:hypothetical protein
MFQGQLAKHKMADIRNLQCKMQKPYHAFDLCAAEGLGSLPYRVWAPNEIELSSRVSGTYS